ncbi:amidase [Kutzneria viridogrisea]|uniref:Amidase n=1 Tax=Kutzneria viridogrisea TaxID=47990 RepID=A0ABR6BCS4_9PSEU|nr:amidase [Kutzneria viridogrisea]
MDLVEVCFAGAAAQAELLRSGELSARELTDALLARIERHDRELNAYRLVFADQARQTASEADERRAHGEDAPLLGVPIAVKEDLALAGLPTTTGTDSVRTVEAADSEVVRRLRAAGAVIIGRTRMPELGLWPFTESASAGATRNPWSTGHTPGGSSGGSAAAVAAGLAGAAIGTDGAGSIRIPAACTGLFGLKPQRGRVSLHPLGEVWTGMVAAGPITRHVRDWALVADQIRGSLPSDPVAAIPPRTSFVTAADTPPPRLRIALSLKPWGVGVPVDPVVRQAVVDTARLLTELGHEVVPRDPEYLDPTSLFGLAPRYLGSAAEGVAALDRPESLERRTRQVAALGRLLPRGLVARSRRFGERLSATANRVFDHAEVLLTPTLTRLPLRVGEWQDKPTPLALVLANQYTGFLPLWNIAGNPAASVPAGFSPEGLPLAVQLVGRPHDECTLLSLAAQVEQARPWADQRPAMS